MLNIRKMIYLFGNFGLLKWMPDKAYLKMVFWSLVGKRLSLNNPQTLNEKLQWLKLYDRKPEYTLMVDKYAVKKYIADKIGEQYIIPTLGVWNHFDEIDFDILPNQFVLKCTHDSGGLVICRDKAKLDMKAAKAKIEKSLRRNYYWSGREWPYKNVPPRIIAEKYMEDSHQDLTDYKMMCFNGTVQCCFTCTDLFANEGLKVTFFDRQWQKMPFTRHYPASEYIIDPPTKLKEMMDLAEHLAKNIPFIRVDFYEIAGELYFGELTVFPGSGFEEFSPQKYDTLFKNWIKLPNRKGYVIEHDGWVFCVFCLSDKQNLKLAESAGPADLRDYKFYCFNGEPKFLYLSEGLSNHATACISFVTMDWKFAPFGRTDYKPFVQLPPKPICFDEMVALAKRLSQGIPFLRVDFYEINKKVYFGELTFCPCAGFMKFNPTEWDFRVGQMLDLPRIKTER